MFRGENAENERDNRNDMGDDFILIPAYGGDAREDEIAGHGGGEDVAMIKVDERVEQAASGGQQRGVEERVGQDSGIAGRHGGRMDKSERIVIGMLVGIERRRIGFRGQSGPH